MKRSFFSVSQCLRGGLVLFLLLASLGFAQESQGPAAKPVSASARLASAKTIYVNRGGGNELPYKVASGIVENWGRFQMAHSAEEADIVLEVTGPSESSGVSISNTTSDSSGHPQSSTKSSRDVPSGPVKFLVYDPKSRLALWSGIEQPKGGFKQKAREENLVEATEKLASRFHERLEPSLLK